MSGHALIPLLVVHLFAAGLASFGPIVAAIWCFRAARRADAAGLASATTLTRWSCGAFCLAVGLGFGLWWAGAFAGNPTPEQQAFGERVAVLWNDHSVTFWGELAFSAVLLGCAARWIGGTGKPALYARIGAILAATNVAYHFPMRFIGLDLIASRPDWSGRTVDAPMRRLLLVDPEFWSRITHHWLAMLVVVGLTMVWIAVRNGSRHAHPSDQSDQMPAGAAGGFRLMLNGIALQMLVGPWAYLMMPLAKQDALLETNVAALGALFAGITTAIGAACVAYGPALGEPLSRQSLKRRAILASVLLVATWSCMCVVGR